MGMIEWEILYTHLLSRPNQEQLQNVQLLHTC
jgi:hypothetical protein